MHMLYEIREFGFHPYDLYRPPGVEPLSREDDKQKRTFAEYDVVCS